MKPKLALSVLALALSACGGSESDRSACINALTGQEIAAAYCNNQQLQEQGKGPQTAQNSPPSVSPAPTDTNTPTPVQTAPSASNPSGTSASTEPAPAPFEAHVAHAPPDGATIGGTTFLFEVRGTSIWNAELLPAVGYEPKYVPFVHGKTTPGTAWSGTWNTTTIPNGVYTVRLSAFDKPAGDLAAREIVTMTRTYQIQNPDCSLPIALGQEAICANPELYWLRVREEWARQGINF